MQTINRVKRFFINFFRTKNREDIEAARVAAIKEKLRSYTSTDGKASFYGAVISHEESNDIHFEVVEIERSDALKK